MLSRTLGLCALSLSLVAPPADELAYTPSTEPAWTLTFEEVSEFELESMVQTVGGTEISGPSPEMSGAISRRITVSDAGKEVKDGRMTRRLRTFDEVESDCKLEVTAMGQGQEFGISFGSELQGSELSIAWDAEEEAHSFAFTEDDAPDARLLEGLLEDLDYQLLMPPEGAEEGDSWNVDLAGARALFSPGGHLELMPSEAPVVRGGIIEGQDLIAIATMSMAEASRQIEGELSATWTETVKDSGRSLVVISLELEAEFVADVADDLEEMTASVDLPPREDYRFESTWEVEGFGELRWDLAAGHFHALDLELESMVEISIGFSESFGDIEVEVETSGETKLTARAEPVE